MTMVLAAMTDDHVFVVSDRRMTNGRTGAVMSSTENKAVVLNDEIVLTYTGLCDLEGLPTDAWVANVLQGEPVERWIRTLLKRVGPAVRRTKLTPALQRHAFLLTGYARTPKGRRAFRPAGFLISNFHSTDGTSLNEAEPKFWLSALRLGNWRVRVDSIGRDLPADRRIALERAIRRQLRAAPDAPRRVLDILGSEIRRVARRDSGVGADLMAISFPATAVGSTLSMAIDPIAANWLNQLVAFYASEDAAPISYGPTYLRPGLQILGLSLSTDPSSRPSTPHRLITKLPVGQRSQGGDRPPATAPVSGG